MVGVTTALAAALTAVVAVFLLLGENPRLPPYEVLMEQHATMTSYRYDLEDLNAPYLTGFPLKLFAALMRTPVLARIAAKVMFKDNQMLEIRRVATSLPDKPLFYPFMHPGVREDLADVVEASLTVQELATFSEKNANARTTTATGFKHWSISDYTSRYASGALSPLQVARAFLAAVDDSERRALPLRIFIDKHDDDILDQARASAARYASGKPLGVLDGVLVVIKDELAVKGYPTTLGTVLFTEVETTDAVSIARLRDAGAIIVGKANMHEIGCGVTGYNKFHGIARNPYDPTCHTGGSSSGSAVAVASGIVPLAVGVDGGGSIRIPAAMCGVVGIKPTFARIPPVAASLVSIGPIAGNVRDAALAYAVMSGGDVGFPSSLTQPPVTLAAFEDVGSLKGLKIGYFSSYSNHSSPEVAAAVEQSMERLKSLGAELVETPLEHLLAIHLAHSLTFTAELAEIYDKYRSRYSEMADETQILLNFAHEFSAVDFLAAQRVRAFAIRQLQEQVYKNVDVFLVPSTGITAPEISIDAMETGELNMAQVGKIYRFSVYGNFAGTPGMSVPIGYDSRGLPISIQIQSNHWNEDVMLRVAHATESLSVITQKAPQVYYSIIEDAAKLSKE